MSNGWQLVLAGCVAVVVSVAVCVIQVCIVVLVLRALGVL